MVKQAVTRLASPTRRSPGEARRLVIASAQELFATNGYSGTSTRQIAEHAGVNYSILYRNFGTKANLFDLAVVEPVRQFLSRYIEQWADHTELARPADIPARAFIGGLYDVLRENRTLVMALVSAHAFEADAFDQEQPPAPLAELLAGLSDFVAAAAERNGFTWLDPAVAIRFTIGLVLSVAVLDDWLFPAQDRALGRDDFVEEMVQFVLHGIAHPRT
ncbi:MAG: TetR/AcrR family transcriptional regulator [Acidimicrobiia bacterium]